MTYLTTRRQGRLPTPGVPSIGDIWDDVVQYINTGSTDGSSVWELLTGGTAITADAAPAEDNVNQTNSGTSTSAADFTRAGGVCKPTNFPALAAVRAFQGQLNRVAQAKGFSKVGTDGAVGPATLALFKKVQAAAPPGSIMGDPASCMTVAPDVDVLGQQVQAFADSLGAPAQVGGPAVAMSVPTVKTKSGVTVVAPDAGFLGSLATLSSGEKLALLGVAGGIGYLLITKKKHHRKPMTTRRR